MSMTGFICHDNYYDRLKRLTNEEVGSLFRQLMLYHAGRYDEMEDFIGNEGIAFDFIAADIDRLEQKNETNSENGSKGGRPKKQEKANETEKNRIKPNESEENRIKPNETEKNRIKPNDTEENRTKAYKDKDKEKDKENIDTDAAADTRAREEKPLIDLTEARRIADEHNEMFDAAEKAGFGKSDATRTKLMDLYSEHGLEKMIYAIDQCVEYGAVNFAYLKKVLAGETKIPRERGPTNGKHPGSIAQAQGEYRTQHPELIDHTIRL